MVLLTRQNAPHEYTVFVYICLLDDKAQYRPIIKHKRGIMGQAAAAVREGVGLEADYFSADQFPLLWHSRHRLISSHWCRASGVPARYG